MISRDVGAPSPNGWVRRGAAALLSAIALVACTQEPVTLVELEVSEAGSFRLSGQDVSKDRLLGAIRAKRPATGKFGVQLLASTKAPAEAVSFAYSTASKAGATVGMVSNETF